MGIFNFWKKKDNVKEEYKKKIIKIIRMELPNCKIYLFGSRARGTHSEGADIDIAIDNGSKIYYRTVWELHDLIESTTIPVFVDVVDLNSVDKKFREQVLNEAILL